MEKLQICNKRRKRKKSKEEGLREDNKFINAHGLKVMKKLSDKVIIGGVIDVNKTSHICKALLSRR